MSITSDLRTLRVTYAHSPEAIQAIKDVLGLVEAYLFQLINPARAKRAEGKELRSAPSTPQPIIDFAPEITF